MKAEVSIERITNTLMEALQKIEESESEMAPVVLEKYEMDLELIDTAMEGLVDNILTALDGFEIAEVVESEP